jgi:oligopeptide transport system permease protein
MENIEISKEDFEFVQSDKKIYDQKFETKNIGFFKDAMIRFATNKASIVAFVIIILIVLFSILAPATSRYESTYTDPYLKYVAPDMNGLFGFNGTRNLDSKINLDGLNIYQNYFPLGTYVSHSGESKYELTTDKKFVAGNKYYLKNDDGTFRLAVKGVDWKVYANVTPNKFYVDATQYVVTYDSYHYRGSYVLLSLTEQDYKNLLKYSVDNHLLDNYTPSSVNNDVYITRANSWSRSENEIIVPYAEKDTGWGGNVAYSKYTQYDSQGNVLESPVISDKVTSEEELKTVSDDVYFSTAYYSKLAKTYTVRVNYYNYYVYMHGFKPHFLFGTNDLGQDLFSRLGNGFRFSLLLGIVVSIINISVGIFIGAIEGYYGGVVDLIIERIIELITNVPTIVICSLMVFHVGVDTFEKKARILIFVFFLSGWTGMAGTVRSQFYRYKGQEYVLAARTLGAKDRRIIFRHILPNAVGPLVTSGVLYIPSVIFSESSLSYLGIINFETGPIASVGSLLSSGQKCMLNAPFVLLFPSIFVAVLMICFNIFGNGLRDAFNPSLRGAE